MRPVRLALIGNGKWGSNYVHAAEQSGEAIVTAIVGRCECVPNDVDAAVVATPPWSHLRRCEEALSLGIPVLVEKPATLSVDDAELLANKEDELDGLVLVGHQHLFAEGYEELRKMVSGCGFDSLSSRWTGPGPYRDYSGLWDYGPHSVAAILGIIGITETIAVSHSSDLDGSTRMDIWDRDGHGVIATAYADNRSTEKTARVVAHIDGVCLEYNAYASNAEPPLTRQVRAFAKAVRAGGTDDWRFGAEWAVNVAKILESNTNTRLDLRSIGR